MKKVTMGVLAAGLLSAAAGSAMADITAVGYNAELIARPADARQGARTSPDTIYCWNELQNVALTSPLAVDISGSGDYTTEAWVNTTHIAAGTRVSSHYIHFETPGGQYGLAAAYLEFDDEILGVVLLGDHPTASVHHLDDSDYLGLGTQYEDGQAMRGVELTGVSDRVIWGSDNRSLTVVFEVDSPGDAVRVITRGHNTCYANCDQSAVAPVLNVLDFSCFLNRFAAGDPWANCDESTSPPVLNVLDFACFLNKFAAGCS